MGGRRAYHLDAQLHSLGVQLDGLVTVPLLVLLERLGHQEVSPLQVHLLPALQWVNALPLDWWWRKKQ